MKGRTIRKAETELELRMILPLARAFTSQENVVCGLDEEHWVKGWMNRLRAPDWAVVLYSYSDDDVSIPAKITGAIGGYLFNDPNDNVLSAKEAFWFMDPRSRGHGRALFAAFEAWAIEHGARRIWMVRLDGFREHAMDSLYTRRGYVPIERAFCKEIEEP
jgi:GNAT superfamily N-acetyltransferase